MVKSYSKAAKRRAQRRKGVSLAPMPERVSNRVTRGDVGPDTQMQRMGRVVEPVTFIMDDGTVKESPNSMRRARRIDLAESYHKRDRNPLLSARQFKAAKRLRDVYEATLKTPPAIKAIQVDSTPKPDQHVDILIDRISKFSAIMRHVPTDCKDVVTAVALDNQAIGRLKQYRGAKHSIGVERLQRGLDMVADALQL